MCTARPRACTLDSPSHARSKANSAQVRAYSSLVADRLAHFSPISCPACLSASALPATAACSAHIKNVVCPQALQGARVGKIRSYIGDGNNRDNMLAVVMLALVMEPLRTLTYDFLKHSRERVRPNSVPALCNLVSGDR